MRVLFLLFIILAPAYSSAQTVIFCQMEANLDWRTDAKKIQTFDLGQFKFSIQNEKKIKFGSDGFFSNHEMDIESYSSPEYFQATSYNTLLVYNNGIFNYSHVYQDSIGLVAATCDKF